VASTTLYENDKRKAQPLLPPGQHRWAFSCTFPESENLPPSFSIRFHDPVGIERIGFFLYTAFILLLTGGFYHLTAVQRAAHARVFYTLQVHFTSDDLGEMRVQQDLNFLPHRITTLERGRMPYRCQVSPTGYFLRIPTGMKERFTMTLLVPQFAVMGEALHLLLSIAYAGNTRFSQT